MQGKKVGANFEALLERARQAYTQTRPGEAVPLLRRLMVLDPRHVDALVIGASALARTGAIGRADALFKRVNKLNVGESRHWRAHVSVLIQARMLNAALRLSRKILIKEPTIMAGLRGLARIADLGGHNEETKRLLHRLHALSPHDPNIATGLARLAMKTGRLEEAENLCRRAVRLSDGKAERLFDLGRVLRARGKFDEADGFLNRAVDMDPTLNLPRRVVQASATDADFRASDP